jgi:hypothetical protein
LPKAGAWGDCDIPPILNAAEGEVLMATTRRCPSCAALLKVPENFHGRAVRCAGCQGVVPVAGPPAAHAIQPVNPAVSRPQAREEVAEVLHTGEGDAGLRSERPRSDPPRPLRSASRTGARRRRSSSAAGRVIAGLVGLGLLGVAVLGLVGWLAYRSLHTSAPAIPAEQWQVLEVPGRVRVLLPGAAQRTAQPAAGLTMVMHMVERHDHDSMYAIGYSEGRLPPHRANLPAAVLLNDSCDGATANLKKQGGEEVSQRDIQLGAYPGKEVVYRLGKGPLITRTYLANGQI